MKDKAHSPWFRWLLCGVAVAGLQPSSHIAAQDTSTSVGLLTLDDAIQIAARNNRSLSIANLEIDKSRWQVSEFKTKVMPSFSATVLGSQLLTPVSFTFKQGDFGSYPGIGPIPGEDTKITTPRRPTALVNGQVSQPLAQLYQIRLGVHAQELNVQLAGEKARAQRQSLVRDVKQAYYAVLQQESAVEAAEVNVKQYRELERVVLQRVSQEAAFQSDSLDVKARLADQVYQLVQLNNTLETRKEYLNDLLGRDIRTPFRTEQVPAVSSEEIELKRAQQMALAQRPEIRQADLNVRRAEYDRRIAKADRIPTVAMVANYVSPFNVDVLPKNVASVGVEVKWEPWDWGRRKAVVSEKAIAERQAEAQLHDTRSKALMDVSSRFRKLEEARALIDVAQASRQASQRRLVEVTNRYEQRAVLLSDVLAQQAVMASAMDRYQQALLGFWNATAELEKSMGEDQ
jgi:outer membrane protein TolC